MTTMKKLLSLLALAVIVFSSYFLFGSAQSSSVTGKKQITILKKPFYVWSAYQGRIESRTVEMIMSKSQGGAIIVNIVPEGQRVAKGDVLVRFDSSAFERELVKLKRDHALAESELESLKQAELPLINRETEVKLLEVRVELNAEEQYLESIIQFAKEGLGTEADVNQQRMKVEKIKMELDTLELQKKLASEYLHPSRLKRAVSKRDSALQELNIVKKQIENSTIRAPIDGVAVLRPIGVGQEHRIVRVGDTVYPNQPFMVIPHMQELIVRLEIPEGELSRVREGLEVIVQPLAFPEMNLKGTVKTVGSIARALPDKPAWKKYFHTIISMKDYDAKVRPGMTVTAQVLSYYRQDALLINRRAVTWKDGIPFCRVVSKGSIKNVALELGQANDSQFEVIKGLNSGDEVLIN